MWIEYPPNEVTSTQPMFETKEPKSPTKVDRRKTLKVEETGWVRNKKTHRALSGASPRHVRSKIAISGAKLLLLTHPTGFDF